MNTSEFLQLADAVWADIQEGIDASGADIDYESSGNVLTLEFPDRSQIVINKQEPLSEIWLASKSGGFHFKYQNQQWICTKTNLELMALIKQECSKILGEEVDW